jgi:hypothetical protein
VDGETVGQELGVDGETLDPELVEGDPRPTLDDPDRDPGLAVHPDREVIAGELGHDRVGHRRHVQSPGSSSPVRDLTHARVVRGEEGADEGGEVPLEDVARRSRVRRPRRDPTPHRCEQRVPAAARARVERALDASGRVVGDVLSKRQSPETEVAAGGDGESPPHRPVPAIGVLIASAADDELPAEVFGRGEGHPHLPLDLGGGGRLDDLDPGAGSVT